MLLIKKGCFKNKRQNEMRMRCNNKWTHNTTLIIQKKFSPNLTKNMTK